LCAPVTEPCCAVLCRMHREIATAVTFLVRLLASTPAANQHSLAAFAAALAVLLRNRLTGHWYLSAPLRGSAFRAIRCSPRAADPLVQEALARCGLADPGCFRGFTLWIDPAEVR
jgi:hypothetical protein